METCKRELCPLEEHYAPQTGLLQHAGEISEESGQRIRPFWNEDPMVGTLMYFGWADLQRNSKMHRRICKLQLCEALKSWVTERDLSQSTKIEVSVSLPMHTVARFLLPSLLEYAGLSAQTPDNAFFEAKIRPVLAKNCYGCHSSKLKAPMGALVLDTKSGLSADGGPGPAIVAGTRQERRSASGTDSCRASP